MCFPWFSSSKCYIGRRGGKNLAWGSGADAQQRNTDLQIGMRDYAIDRGLFRRLEALVVRRWDVAPR
jgi:hypothetical protein